MEADPREWVKGPLREFACRIQEMASRVWFDVQDNNAIASRGR